MSQPEDQPTGQLEKMPHPILEMETAGIYGLAAALGHQAVSCNVILANRATQVFSKQPGKIMDHYIKVLLEKISAV